jgi:hypothetical protein
MERKGWFLLREGLILSEKGWFRRRSRRVLRKILSSSEWWRRQWVNQWRVRNDLRVRKTKNRERIGEWKPKWKMEWSVWVCLPFISWKAYNSAYEEVLSNVMLYNSVSPKALLEGYTVYSARKKSAIKSLFQNLF